jgi:hypothetical protein
MLSQTSIICLLQNMRSNESLSPFILLRGDRSCSAQFHYFINRSAGSMHGHRQESHDIETMTGSKKLVRAYLLVHRMPPCVCLS